MGKTIEEASQEYACSIQPDRLGRGDLESAFEAGVDYIMELPLRDRLTDEEREKILAMYHKDLQGASESEQDSDDYHFHISRLWLMESIFGKEFFTDKKNEQ